MTTSPAEPRWLLLIGGVVGLGASIQLTIDKIELAKNAGKSLACDFSAFVSCSDVIASDQSSAFGFPNPLIGIVGFSIVVTLSVLLLAGTALPKFVWLGLQAGTVFGIGFVTWLQYQSLYNINALCPYCMVVWAAMIPIFVAVTARNLRAYAPDLGLSQIIDDWKGLIIALWFVVICSLIWFEFGSRLWA